MTANYPSLLVGELRGHIPKDNRQPASQQLQRRSIVERTLGSSEARTESQSVVVGWIENDMTNSVDVL